MTDQRTPEIPETPETHGALETNLSRTGATALEFRHRFSTTSLSPYGMSFWALILAACGGGGGGGGGPVASTATVQPEKLTREGYVYDGPVKGAVVYVDVNDDGQLNPGIDEYVGTTTSTGEFRGSISARNNGKRYIVDLTKAKDLGDDKIEGTEDDQDLSEFGIWLAPEGASVVSALTHLIATGVYNELEVKSTFPGFDPLRDNPYKQGLSPEKEAVFEIVRKALPGITRLVKENRELIQKNTLKIERNSEDLRALKDEINELKAKVAAIKQVAAQSSSQEPEEPSAPTTSLPNPAPAPIPPTNAAPTGVALSRTTHSVDEGSTVSGALTRITITDDGLGTVTLRPLPQNSIFEYRPVVGERGVYELHLKSGVTLDQSKIGAQTVTIQATGNGVGDDPAAVTFILTVINNPDDDVAVPVFATGNSVSVSIAEGTTATGYDANATATSGIVSYAITDGTDRDKFTINQTSGVVTFKTNSDYDSWADVGRDNTYNIIVTATATSRDGQHTRVATQQVAITLTNDPDDDVTAPPSQTTTAPTPPPGFSSGSVGTDLMEHATGQNVQVYDAAATIGAGSTGEVRFSLENAPEWLQINSTTGVVTMTRPVDLDAKGEASRNVSFTVVATDTADTSRTAEQTVSFTITNSDEQPTGMTVTVTNASFSENVDKTNGLELARVRFTDADNPALDSQNNSVQITSVRGLPAHRLNKDDFGVRRLENGDLIIYLKATANTTITADTTFTVTLASSTTGEGTSFSARRTFEVTMVDVEHKPEITRIDTVNPLIEAKRYNQGEDTGVRFRVTDADGDIVTTRPPTIDNPNFRLVQTAPGLHADPRNQEWKLFVERGSNLTAGETITLTITAYDQDDNAAVETFTFTVGERAPDNAQPIGVALSREAHQIDKDVDLSAVGALVRIIISDDGKGTVGLQTLPQDSIFEYQKISRVVYELHLKTNLTLDQSKVGEHRVIIQATGNGVGDNPAAETFILTVRDGAQVSQPDPAQPTNPSPPVVPTDDEVSTLAIRLRDPDAQQTEIRETPGGLLSPENSGPRARETGFFLDVIKNGTNMVNFFGGLTYSPLQVEWDAQTGPKYRIERKTSDGTYESELRFVIRDNGKLSLRPDRVLDYEAETGPDGRPNGLIELRITIAEAKKKGTEAEAKKGVEATFDINIQLTNVNERPSGPTPPEGGNRGSINLMYGDEDSRSVYKPYDSDRPRLLPNTEFSINKEAFSDIDGDVLHYAYQWFKVGSASNRLLSREETFTPTAAGWYQLGLRVSDRPLNSDFTIPSGGFGLDYSQSFEVFEPTPLIGGEGALSLSIAENTTWDSALAAIDFANNGDRIAGTYKIHSVNGRYMSEHPLFKMDSHGSQLWLKTLETTLDHERVVSDDQGDLQLLNSYEIVLRHYLQLGSNLGTRGDVTFTLNVTNVEESPEIKFRNNITELQFAADNTRDTGGRITINDPDVPVIRPENDPVTYELSETAFLNGDIINSPTSRFELIMLDQASYWRGAPNGSTYYKIMAKDRANLYARRSHNADHHRQ
jgi:hypothetical protein